MKRLYDKALMDQIAKVYGNEVAFLSEFSRALLDIIREGLIRDGQVRLHQFGTFKLKWMNSRKGVNPSTGNSILIQGRPRVIFTPAKGLKDTVEPSPLPRVPWEEAENDTVSQVLASSAVNLVAKDTELKNEAPDAVPAVVIAKATKLDTVSKKDIQETDKALFEKPEPVVADINDEIDVLEQVVDILKKESRSPVSEKVTAGISQEHRQKPPLKPPVNPFAPHLEKKDLEWNDQTVVDHIKKLSEIDYFNNAEEKQQPKFKVPEIVVRTDRRSAVYETSDVKSDHDLDQELNSVSKASQDSLNESEHQHNSKPWFAIASAVIVLLATGILFNALVPDKSPMNTQSAAEQVASVPGSEVKYISSELEDSSLENQQEFLVEETVAEVSQTEAVTVTEELSSDASRLDFVQPEPEPEVADEVVAANTDSAIEEDRLDVAEEVNAEFNRLSSAQQVFFAARDYRLVNGDSLWRLAEKHYVNPFYWPHIYQANQNKIVNPDRVKMGKVVTLPTLYGEPDALTQQDKHNIAMGYFYNYLFHKDKGNPYAYFSLIGVKRFDSELLIEFKKDIERSDVENLALLSE